MAARVRSARVRRRPADHREVTWDVLSERITDIVVLADCEGIVSYASPACRSLGYSPSDLIGKGLADFLHPDDLPRATANTKALFSGAPPATRSAREHRVRRKDGSWVWLEGNPGLIPGPDGRPVGLINVFRDVNDRHAAQAALADSERRMRLLAENTTDVISRTCVQTGRITYLSPSVEPRTGYSAEELIGQRMVDLVHPDDRTTFIAAFRDLVAGRRADGQAIRFRGRTKQGRWLWLESNPRLVLGPAGEPQDIIDVTRDVTVQQALEEQLHIALAEAERLATVKSEFLANMSHEIRTPLTAVLGFTGLLNERSDLPDEAHAQVQRIAAAGRALLAIVNDVLDFSKLEAGQVTIAPRSTPPVSLVREAVELFEAQAAEKRLTLSFLAPSAAPDLVRIDGDRVRQILVNLIGNAVKFTDRGGVEVRAAYDPAAERLAIEVADTGPGIAAAQRERLFQRFTQADGSSTRAKGGTGLGLAISRGLAEAMGGTLTLRSRVGRGSTFRLELPAPPAELVGDVGLAADPDLLDGLRVLIADDNSANRELAGAILRPLGVEVSEAADGLQAAATAAAVPMDVILMDLRMPGLDGAEATRLIRQRPGPNRDIPILSFSAEGEGGQAAGRAGMFSGSVSKPISAASLVAAIAEAVGAISEPAREASDVAH